MSKYGVISGPYFPVSLRSQSECGKIRARNNSVFGHFSRSVRKGYNIIGQILLLISEQWKNLIKDWKKEAFKQNYFRKIFFSMHFIKFTEKTCDETVFYLSHILGHYRKKLHHKRFSTTFVKFFKIAIL